MVDFKKILQNERDGKMGFDRAKFLAANQRARENNPALVDIDAGIYLVNLIDASRNLAKSSGREQITFVWQVNEPGEKWNEKKIYEHYKLDDDKSMEFLSSRLATLGVKDFDAFAQDEQTFDKNLAYLANRTKARLKVHFETKEGVEYQRLRIQGLIEKADFGGEISQSAPINNSQKTVEVPITTKDAQFSPGQKVIAKHTSGKEALATVKQCNNALQKVFLAFDDEALGAHMYSFTDIVNDNPALQTTSVSQESEEIIEEIVEEVELKVGMEVKFNFNNVVMSGKVDEIVDQNKVKIIAVDPADGKKKKYPVTLDKLVMA